MLRSSPSDEVSTQQGPHFGADEALKQNLAPHGPFRVPACAPPSLVATAPPSLSGARRSPDEPAGRQTLGRDQQPRREAWAGEEARGELVAPVDF